MEIHGTGTAQEFNGLLDELAPLHQLRLRRYADGYGPSDHASFHERGVPVLHFFTGLHKDYHRPSDDFGKLNVEGMRRIALLTADIALAITGADERPTRQDSDLLGLDDLAGAGVPSPRRIKLGVRAKDQNGRIVVVKVIDRTPAWQAGLRQGDFVVALDGVKLRGAQEFLETIRKCPAGKKIRLHLARGAVKMEMVIPLSSN